jgi:hypothetical protein
MESWGRNTCVEGVLVTEIGFGCLHMRFLSMDLNYSVYSREVQFGRLKA